MRPVNLIPPEERRGDRAPTRTGPVSYLLVGALALAVAGVSAVVLTSNEIADKKQEVAELESREAAATEKATALASYADFAATKEARALTVDSLAKSRFDWERVLRELALVIPSTVQLTGVTGTAAPGTVPEGASASNNLRAGATGPALELSGCAGDHEAVAELAAALEDIDGVTRVAVNGSELATEDSAGAGAGGSDCTAVPGVSTFEMIATFDEVTVPTAAAAVPPATTPATTEEAAADESAEGAGVADAEATQAAARDSAAEQSDKSREAAGLVPGVAR